MNIWDLEGHIIDVIAVELQVPRVDIRPQSHIVEDLGADWLSMERLCAALQARLGLQVAPGVFSRRVWDVVKEYHNRYNGREAIVDRSPLRGRPRPDELPAALSFRPVSAPLLTGSARRRAATA